MRLGINVGDVVYLKSGSPAMTVTSITASLTEHGQQDALCQWVVADMAIQRAVFPLVCLTTVKPA